MKTQNLPEAHIFVCINEKAPEKSQCLKGEGERCVEWLKDQVEKRNLKGRLRVTKTKCLGYCDKEGTSIVFEPVHRQYSGVVLADVQKLFEEFLVEQKSFR